MSGLDVRLANRQGSLCANVCIIISFVMLRHHITLQQAVNGPIPANQDTAEAFPLRLLHGQKPNQPGQDLW